MLQLIHIITIVLTLDLTTPNTITLNTDMCYGGTLGITLKHTRTITLMIDITLMHALTLTHNHTLTLILNLTHYS